MTGQSQAISRVGSIDDFNNFITISGNVHYSIVQYAT